jgi:valyl-tRNA synthetase
MKGVPTRGCRAPTTRIATQMLVERDARQGRHSNATNSAARDSSNALGVERKIRQQDPPQIRRLGASSTDEERFTLDEGLSKAEL